MVESRRNVANYERFTTIVGCRGSQDLRLAVLTPSKLTVYNVALVDQSTEYGLSADSANSPLVLSCVVSRARFAIVWKATTAKRVGKDRDDRARSSFSASGDESGERLSRETRHGERTRLRA